MVPLLLHDEPLNGAVGIQRWLTARREVHLVDPSSLADAAAAVEEACNIWGGAYHPLVPVPGGAVDIPEPWRTLVLDTVPADTVVRGRMAVPRPARCQVLEAGGLPAPAARCLSPSSAA
jgi:hypothetical protein